MYRILVDESGKVMDYHGYDEISDPIITTDDLPGTNWYTVEKIPIVEQVEFYNYELYFEGEEIEVRYVLDTDKCYSEVNSLLMKLKETDYMVLKAAEQTLCGLQSDYNIEELHSERQAYRDKINNIEFFLTKV